MKIKVKEITPKHARCGVGPCPSLFQSDRKTVFIIGTAPAIAELPLKLQRKIGRGEVVIEVPCDLLSKQQERKE